MFDQCNKYAYAIIKKLVKQPNVDTKFLEWQVETKLAYAHYITITKGNVVTDIMTVEEIPVVE